MTTTPPPISPSSKAYPSDVLSCWVVFEAFRRLGFKPDEIYLSVDEVAPALQAPIDVCSVAVRSQGLEMVAVVAPLTRDRRLFLIDWERFGAELNTGIVPDAVLQQMWDSRRDEINGLVPALVSLGFKIPGKKPRRANRSSD